MTAPVLELRSVSKTFHIRRGLFGAVKPLHAVTDVSLCLARGETLGLVGESGCGKTTVARILLGLLTPTTGQVLVDGTPVTRLPRRRRAALIQPIFQDPYASLNPRKTVAKIVGLPLSLRGDAGGDARRQTVLAMLDRVGLPRRVEHTYPSQLSGGQRQRVAIARALITRPQIVICDEPTSALDVSVQSQILNLLMELRTEFGLSYLFISHNLAVVEHMADRVAVMYLGRVVETAPAGRLFEAPRHPYANALLDAVLTPEPALGIPNIPLGTAYPNPIDPPSGCAFHPRCPRIFNPCSSQRPPLVTRADGAVACHLWTSEESAP